jgi:hypothetical protein
MGTHRFTSVGVASKFSWSNVRGIFVGGLGEGDGGGLEAGGFDVGTVDGDFVVGATVPPSPVHAEARRHRQTAATIDVMPSRVPRMSRMLDPGI